MYDKVISIGATCQVATHIRKQLQQTEAYYFDWLISPLPAVIFSIKSWFDGILQPENLTYSDSRKIRLTDAANGLQYQHDFPVDKDNPDPSRREEILPDFAVHISAVREKYLRRVNRMKAALSRQGHILLIRYVQIADDLADEHRFAIVQAFQTQFPSSRLTFLWASQLISEHKMLEDGNYMCHLPKSDKWDGDSAGWSDVFKYCGAI